MVELLGPLATSSNLFKEYIVENQLIANKFLKLPKISSEDAFRFTKRIVLGGNKHSSISYSRIQQLRLQRTVILRKI